MSRLVHHNRILRQLEKYNIPVITRQLIYKGIFKGNTDLKAAAGPRAAADTQYIIILPCSNNITQDHWTLRRIPAVR